MKRSSEPKIARCSITGVWRLPSSPMYVAPSRAGHVEVDLQRAALPIAADRVAQHELDLRPVERAFAFVQRVRQAERVHRVLRARASARSQTSSSPTRFGGRSANFMITFVEAEAAVDVEQQLAHFARFLGDLRLGAEHVRVVLRERAHAHESVQRARRFVAVHLAELREAVGQIAIAAQVVLEDLDVAGAVHRLDDERLLVGRRAREHVLAERVPSGPTPPRASAT